MAGDLCEVADVLAEGDQGEEDASADLTLLGSYISEFSTAITNFCSWSFDEETIENEIIMYPDLLIRSDGHLQIHTRKANILSVNSVSWRPTIKGNSFNAVEQDDILFFPSLDGTIRANSGIVRLVGTWQGYRNEDTLASFQVKMSYVGGFESIPGPVKRACARLVWWSYKQRDTPPQGRTAIPQLGVLIIPDSWPNSVVTLLNGYKNVRL